MLSVIFWQMLVLATVFPVGAMEESKNFIYVVSMHCRVGKGLSV